MRAVSQCRWDHVNKNARSRVVFCSISRAALKDLQCCISCQQVPSVFSIPPAWTHITSFLTRALIDHSNIRELEAIEQAKRRSFFFRQNSLASTNRGRVRRSDKVDGFRNVEQPRTHQQQECHSKILVKFFLYQNADIFRRA